MKSPSIFLLDDNEAIRVLDLFGQRISSPDQARSSRWILVCLLAFMLLALVSVAFGQDRPGGKAEADAPPIASPAMHGQTTEKGHSLSFTLRYAEGRPLLRIDGIRYDCLLTGKLPAIPGSSASARSYAVTSSGGLCDALLGGRIEIDVNAGEPAQARLLRSFNRKGVKLHELSMLPVAD